MNPLNGLKARLQALESQDLLRVRTASGANAGLIDVCSNDYLGLGRQVVSRETAGTSGAGASRLIGGTTQPHEELERALADWVGMPQTLLFSSGYAANVGAISSLAGPGHVVISDELNHASIIDGCRLSRARVVVVPHRDTAAVARALGSLGADEPAWVVTESYFSMDGDSPDLPALRNLCDAAGAALYVDEAHALGVFGSQGAGLCHVSRVKPDVLVGTLGKAVGVQGAFVAARGLVLDYLWNHARSFVFSTAPSPVLTAVALDNLRRVRAAELARRRLETLSTRLREALGPRLASSQHGPVFPIVVGTPERAARLVSKLREVGFFAVSIRPPTVPAGTSRLRVSLRANLADDDFLRLAAALKECLAL